MPSKMKLLLNVVTAARCIKHWHDGKIGKDEYFVVSGEAVRDLWQALADFDAIPKSKGTKCPKLKSI